MKLLQHKKWNENQLGLKFMLFQFKMNQIMPMIGLGGQVQNVLNFQLNMLAKLIVKLFLQKHSNMVSNITMIFEIMQQPIKKQMFGLLISYGTQRSQMVFPELGNDSRELWMTEVYVPNSSSDADTWPEAVEVAINMHNALVVGSMNAYVWWYIRRSYGPMKENGNISKRGYMMAQFSKQLRPDAVRVDATESPSNNVYVSAYKNADGTLIIVAINNENLLLDIKQLEMLIQL